MQANANGLPVDGVILIDKDTGLAYNAGGTSSTITTATLSNVSASASSVTVLAANTSRKRAVIHNDSTAKVRLKFGSTASASSFTYALNAYETYETPTSGLYTGIITGIWDSATGTARVTEMV